MRLAVAAVLALLALAPAAAEPPPHGPGVIGAPGGSGRSPAVAEVDPSLPGHTLYRPARLPRGKLPIVVWGNGACRDNGLAYASFLRQIASHGYLVIAVGHARFEELLRPARPPTSEAAPPADAPGVVPAIRAPDETTASQLVEAISWAVAENRRRASRYFHRLDDHAVAVMGHSCGGLQAIATAAHPRVKTALIFNSGVYNRGPGAGRSNIVVTKDQLGAIHGPIAYINGGPSDIASANALDDFERITHVPALFAWLPVGHGGTFFTQPDGGAYGHIAVKWLDWQLKRDGQAAHFFSGATCKLCQRKEWTIRRKLLR